MLKKNAQMKCMNKMLKKLTKWFNIEKQMHIKINGCL